MSKFDILKGNNVQVLDVKLEETSQNDLVTNSHKVDNREKIPYMIEVSKLVAFKNQPFRAYSDEKLELLARSIKENGVFSPILVRLLDDDKYEIIAGHNRVNACRLIGMATVPSVVTDVDDDTAKILLVESNLLSRTEILHSEKAFAYKMQYEALKKQGKRNDLSSGTVCQNLKTTAETMSEASKDGEKRIRQYVKIAELIIEFLELLDAETLPFLSAYNLSFLDVSSQRLVYSFLIEEKKYNIDIKLSLKIKDIGDAITRKDIENMINAPDKPLKIIKIRYKEIKKYFKNEDEKEINNIIIKALDKYFGG